MRHGKEVVGMSVVTCDKGHELGRVKDLIVHRVQNRVVGLLMRQGGWFQHARVLPLSDVLSFGADAIMVPSEKAVVESEQVPDIQRILEQKKMLGGTILMTANGNEIGKVKDVRFDENSGSIEGFEVVTGGVADANSARAFLPAGQDVVVGEGAVLVSDDAAERLMQVAGGVERPDQSSGQTPSNPSASDRTSAATSEFGR